LEWVNGFEETFTVSASVSSKVMIFLKKLVLVAHYFSPRRGHGSRVIYRVTSTAQMVVVAGCVEHPVIARLEGVAQCSAHNRDWDWLVLEPTHFAIKRRQPKGVWHLRINAFSCRPVV
jgi:hypothetical protein